MATEASKGSTNYDSVTTLHPAVKSIVQHQFPKILKHNDPEKIASSFYDIRSINQCDFKMVLAHDTKAKKAECLASLLLGRDDLIQVVSDIKRVCLLTNREDLLHSIFDGFNRNLLDREGRSVLHFAVLTKDVTLVSLYLRDKTSSSTIATLYKGSTALHVAIEITGMPIDIIALLAKDGRLTNIDNEDGLSPLQLSIVLRKFRITEILIRYGGSVYKNFEETRIPSDVLPLIPDGAMSTCRGATVLHFLALVNAREILKATSEYKINVNAQDANGLTPLMYGAIAGSTTAVKALLFRQAKIKYRSNDGKTAAHYAARYNHTEVLQEILSKSDHPNPVCLKTGITPIMIACQYRSLESIQALLSMENLDLTLIDRDKNTVLHHAVMNNCTDLIDFIIQNHPSHLDRVNRAMLSPLLNSVTVRTPWGNSGCLHLLKTLFNAHDQDNISKILTAVINMAGRTKNTQLLLDVLDPTASLTNLKIGVDFDQVILNLIPNVKDESICRITEISLEVVEDTKKKQRIVGEYLQKAVENSSEILSSMLIRLGVSISTEILKRSFIISIWNGLSSVVNDFLEIYPFLISIQSEDNLNSLQIAIIKKDTSLVSLLLKKDTSLISKCLPFKMFDEGSNSERMSGAYENVGTCFSQESKELSQSTCSKNSYSSSLVSPDEKYGNLHETCLVKIPIRTPNGERLFLVDQGLSPLQLAVRVGGDKEMLNILYSFGGDPDRINIMGRTCFHYACASDNVETLGWLLEKHVNVNKADNMGQTAFCMAVSCNSVMVAEILVRNENVDISTQCSKRLNRLSPLHVAVQKGYDYLVKLIVEGGANLETKDCDGFTPLMYGIQNNHMHICKFLLENGAILGHIVEPTKGTAAHLAAQYCDLDMFEMLFASGMTSTSLRDAQNTVPLHLAVASGNYNVVKFLVAHDPSQITTETTSGITPLAIAAMLENSILLQLLLQSLRRLNVTTTIYGERACFFAVEADSLENLQELETFFKLDTYQLKHPINSYSLFTHAIIHDSISVSKYLMLKYPKFSTHTVGERHLSPIHIATIYNSANVINILVTRKTIAIKDSLDMTALLYSCACGNIETLEKIIPFIQDTRPQEMMAPLEPLLGNDDFHLCSSINITNIFTHLIDKTHLLRNLRSTTDFNATHTESTDSSIFESDLFSKILAKNGARGLHLAVIGKHTDIVGILIEKNIYEINTSDKNGNTGMHYCAAIPEIPTEIMEIFKKSGADLCRPNNLNQTPFYLALDCGNNLCSNWLLDNLSPRELMGTIMCETTCIKQETILHAAARQNNTNAISRLLQIEGNHLNSVDARGYTPIMCAIEARATEAVAFLLGQPALNLAAVTNKHKRSCLHLAAINKIHVIMSMLHGKCDERLVDIMGKTAYEYFPYREWADRKTWGNVRQISRSLSRYAQNMHQKLGQLRN